MAGDLEMDHCVVKNNFFLLAALVLAAGLSACFKPPHREIPPQKVEVVEVEQKDVPIYMEWVGTLDGYVNAKIQAQVTGYLLKQEYKEGMPVKKGELMFEIDPRQYQAKLDQAKGDLSEAKAEQVRTSQNVARYRPLAQESAISQEELDDAVQSDLSAQAKVQAAQAAVEQAALNLSFCRIISPIDGLAGFANAQIGDLMSPNGTALTTVSTINPIKVYFVTSEQNYLAYIRERPTAAARAKNEKELELELILADGKPFPSKGKFLDADRQVDVKTGTLTLTGLFENPNLILRPGQFAKVRAVTRIDKGALLVPQRAVTELQGSYQVAVVGPDNKVDIRTVKMGDRVEQNWIVKDGLKAGEKIISEGVQRVKQGSEVVPVPPGTPIPAMARPAAGEKEKSGEAPKPSPSGGKPTS